MNVSLLAGFLLRTIAWLLACLGICYLLGEAFTWTIHLLASTLVGLTFPAWAEGIEQTGTTLALLTSLSLPPPPGAPTGQIALLTAEADYLTIGYGLPLLCALLLASWPARLATKLAWGAAALLPFQVCSVVFTWWKQIAISSGPVLASQIQVGEFGRNLIGLGYQFGTLVLPTLIPVVLWLALDRKLISTLLMEAYLERARPEDPAKLNN